MSADATMALRTLAFGDLGTRIWGCAWGKAAPLLAVGRPEPGEPLRGTPADIHGSSPDQEWTVGSDGIELLVSPETDAATSPAIGGFDQLCRVRGSAVIDGTPLEFDVSGRRGSRSGVDFGQCESIRDVCAWFGPGDGIALTSLRPRSAKGQDRDVIAAAVFEPSGPLAVADPRLSTTYAADGHPLRVGLELWLEEGEAEEQYPRRVAAEPLGAAAAWSQPEADVEAYFLRCLSRGEEGLGVYVLGRTG